MGQPRQILDLEGIVRQSIHDLRASLGKQWLSNRLFGIDLHTRVAARIEAIAPIAGWYIGAEQPIRNIPQVRRDLLDQPVMAYLEGDGAGLHMYRAEVARITRPGALVGDLRPDLVVRPPDGTLVVWDLTSRETEHLVKTMLYAQVLTQLGQLARIGETYWAQKDGF